MKTQVASTELLKLLPENDADKALLHTWSESECGIASQCYSEGQVLSILLQFRPRDIAPTPPLPDLQKGGGVQMTQQDLTSPEQQQPSRGDKCRKCGYEGHEEKDCEWPFPQGHANQVQRDTDWSKLNSQVVGAETHEPTTQPLPADLAKAIEYLYLVKNNLNISDETLNAIEEVLCYSRNAAKQVQDLQEQLNVANKALKVFR